MSIKTKNPQAFPGKRSVEIDHPHDDYMVVYDGGMDLRDYFAAKAMQAIITNERIRSSYQNSVIQQLTEEAYEVADAMMEAREATCKAENESYEIIISEEFFTKNYPEWDNYRPEKKQVIRDILIEAIDGHLSAGNLIPEWLTPEGIEIKKLPTEDRTLNT